MSSGQRRVKFNNLEMAISGDFNKSQDFLAAHANNAIFRVLSRASTGFKPSRYPIQDTLQSLPTGTHGTVHDCMGGLMVNCDNSGYLLVTPGSAGFFAPGFGDAGVDDSDYVIVNDFGVGNSNVLTFTANSSGNPRIDVIECRPEATVELNEPRNIFSTITKLFTPTAVDKRLATKLEYRIRLGTPGGGFPDVDQGWMPLAVARVPSGASGFLQCDFWDVRPLVSWRAPELYGSGSPTEASGAELGAQLISRQIWQSGSSNYVALGSWSAYVRGYVAGGELRRASDTNGIDTTASELQATGSSAPGSTAGDLNALMAIFPMGLPRWARYTTSAVVSTSYAGQNPKLGRIPVGSTGIMVLGKPNVGRSGECNILQMPAIFGGSASVFPGFVVCWTIRTYSGTNQVINVNHKTHVVPYEPSSGGTPWQYDNTWSASSLPAAGVTFSKSLSVTSGAPSWLNNADQPLPITACRAKLWVGSTYILASSGQTIGTPELIRNQNGAQVRLAVQRDQASNFVALSGTDITFERLMDVELDADGATALELSNGASANINSASARHRIMSWEDF